MPKISLKEKLEQGKFVVTAELEPPKGTDLAKTLGNLKFYKDVDGVNVTDNQRAIMRLGPISTSHILIDNGIEPICQFTCRDKNVLGLQSDLLSAYVLGIRNVVVMGGDDPKYGDHPNAKPVFELDAVGLLKTIKKLSTGQDFAGNKIEGSPNFFIGAVANPGAKDIDIEISKFRAKLDGAAEFFQTQAVYEPENFKTFIEKIEEFNAKIIAGIIPLKSAKMARFMNEKVPGIHVPEGMINEIEQSSNPVETGIMQAVKIINKLKGISHGVHLMTIGKEESIPEIIEKAELWSSDGLF